MEPSLKFAFKTVKIQNFRAGCKIFRKSIIKGKGKESKVNIL